MIQRGDRPVVLTFCQRQTIDRSESVRHRILFRDIHCHPAGGIAAFQTVGELIFPESGDQTFRSFGGCNIICRGPGEGQFIGEASLVVFVGDGNCGNGFFALTACFSFREYRSSDIGVDRTGDGFAGIGFRNILTSPVGGGQTPFVIAVRLILQCDDVAGRRFCMSNNLLAPFIFGSSQTVFEGVLTYAHTGSVFGAFLPVIDCGCPGDREVDARDIIQTVFGIRRDERFGIGAVQREEPGCGIVIRPSTGIVCTGRGIECGVAHIVGGIHTPFVIGDKQTFCTGDISSIAVSDGELGVCVVASAHIHTDGVPGRRIFQTVLEGEVFHRGTIVQRAVGDRGIDHTHLFRLAVSPGDFRIHGAGYGQRCADLVGDGDHKCGGSHVCIPGTGTGVVCLSGVSCIVGCINAPVVGRIVQGEGQDIFAALFFAVGIGIFAGVDQFPVVAVIFLLALGVGDDAIGIDFPFVTGELFIGEGFEIVTHHRNGTGDRVVSALVGEADSVFRNAAACAIAGNHPVVFRCGPGQHIQHLVAVAGEACIGKRFDFVCDLRCHAVLGDRTIHGTGGMRCPFAAVHRISLADPVGGGNFVLVVHGGIQFEGGAGKHIGIQRCIEVHRVIVTIGICGTVRNGVIRNAATRFFVITGQFVVRNQRIIHGHSDRGNGLLDACNILTVIHHIRGNGGCASCEDGSGIITLPGTLAVSKPLDIAGIAQCALHIHRPDVVRVVGDVVRSRVSTICRIVGDGGGRSDAILHQVKGHGVIACGGIIGQRVLGGSIIFEDDVPGIGSILCECGNAAERRDVTGEAMQHSCAVDVRNGTAGDERIFQLVIIDLGVGKTLLFPGDSADHTGAVEGHGGSSDFGKFRIVVLFPFAGQCAFGSIAHVVGRRDFITVIAVDHHGSETGLPTIGVFRVNGFRDFTDPGFRICFIMEPVGYGVILHAGSQGIGIFAGIKPVIGGGGPGHVHIDQVQDIRIGAIRRFGSEHRCHIITDPFSGEGRDIGNIGDIAHVVDRVEGPGVIAIDQTEDLIILAVVGNAGQQLPGIGSGGGIQCEFIHTDLDTVRLLCGIGPVQLIVFHAAEFIFGGSPGQDRSQGRDLVDSIGITCNGIGKCSCHLDVHGQRVFRIFGELGRIEVAQPFTGFCGFRRLALIVSGSQIPFIITVGKVLDLDDVSTNAFDMVDTGAVIFIISKFIPGHAVVCGVIILHIVQLFRIFRGATVSEVVTLHTRFVVRCLVPGQIHIHEIGIAGIIFNPGNPLDFADGILLEGRGGNVIQVHMEGIADGPVGGNALIIQGTHAPVDILGIFQSRDGDLIIGDLQSCESIIQHIRSRFIRILIEISHDFCIREIIGFLEVFHFVSIRSLRHVFAGVPLQRGTSGLSGFFRADGILRFVAEHHIRECFLHFSGFIRPFTQSAVFIHSRNTPVDFL